MVVPFLPEHQPALGVSSLAAVLHAAGIGADVRYLNLEYYARVGRSLYKYVSQGVRSELLVGEMVFARALWGDEAPPWDAFVSRLQGELDHASLELLPGDARDAAERRHAEWEEHAPRLAALHEDAPRVVGGWAEALLGDRPAVLGFTTTFQQNLAALAVAREVRRLVPREECAILFGGANCEDEMGRALAASFPFVDHVVSGEGERVVLDLVARVLGRGEPAPRFVPGAAVEAMDALPEPRFEDYFAGVAGLELEGSANLVVESARGCWWGAKAHCTFCGLNGNTMAFRSKAPGRFAEELRSLATRYGRTSFIVADNILDMGYLRTLFPELIAAGDEVRLFYETKANLKKEHLELMAAGGVFLIQPGIESLSTAVLARMAKGTTRLQNLQLLKWCGELGIDVKWNLLYGFPGEDPADYAEMASLLPDLVHLPVPNGVFRIRLDRFSPYWKDPARHGLSGVRPFWAYDHAYGPLTPGARAGIAYFFDHAYADGRDPDGYVRELQAAGGRWLRRHEDGATLEVRDAGGEAVVVDSRYGAPETTPVSAPERRLLRLLDAARSPRGLAPQVNEGVPEALRMGDGELQACLDALAARRWVVQEGGRVLSLVLDRTERRRVPALRARLQLEREGLSLPPELLDMKWMDLEER